MGWGLHRLLRNFFQIGFLFLVVSSALANASAARLGARRYDITQEALKTAGLIPLLGNKSIKLTLPTHSRTRIIFEDRAPGANWTHPAAFLVLNQTGQVIEEIKTNRPPLFWKDRTLPGMTLEGILTETPVNFQISSLDGKYKVAEPDRHFALLFNGQGDQRHWNDFSFLYRVLREVYGYKKENILVADSVFRERQPDLDADGTPDIKFASDRAGLEGVITLLKSTLKADDQLLLVLNDHGARQGNESTLILQDQEIKASEFTKLFEGLGTQRIFSIFEQCYSGGFVRPMTMHPGNARVSMAAAMDIELSWATEDLNFNEFLYLVISAFAFQTHEGKPVNADSDSNGKVSAQEAFTYATGKDLTPENPLLESAPNLGLARTFGFALP